MNRYVFWTLLVWVPCLSLAAVQYQNNTWQVYYEREQLGVVMQDLEQTAGLSYELRAGVDGIVDADFTAPSLTQALQRLLVDYNFLTQRREENLHIVILSRKQPRSVPSSAAMLKPQAKTPQKQELILRRQNSEPFTTAGAINNRPVSLLIDTGASVVALSESLGRRLGLRFGPRQTVNTANGKTTGYSTILPSLHLGHHLTLTQVQAVIIPGMQMGDQVLLGLNVLQQFELIQRHNELIIRAH